MSLLSLQMIVFFVIIGLVILIIGLVILVWYVNPIRILIYLINRIIKKAAPIAERLQKETATIEEDGVSIGTQNGIKYLSGYTNPLEHEYKSSFFVAVEVEGGFAGTFEVIKERSISISYSRPKTNDPVFDKEFLINTQSPIFTAAFLQIPDVRQIIKRIFDSGCRNIRCDKKTLGVTWNIAPFPSKNEVDYPFITSIVSLLSSLMNAAREIPAIIEDNSVWQAKKAKTLFWIPIILLPIGLILFISGSNNFPPLDTFTLFLQSIKYSLISIAAFIFITMMFLKGKHVYKNVIAGILVFSIFSFPLTGMGLALYLNGWGDTSPPKAHIAKVVAKRHSSGSGAVSYHLQVESWRRQGETEEIEITETFYRQIDPSKTILRIITKQGRLGFEWIESYNIHPP